jgi:hypothetical protein
VADSLTKVGSFPIFTIEPNWAKDMSSDYFFSKRLIGHPGTVIQLEEITAKVPNALGLSFQCSDKREEYDLLVFFLSRLGRVKRFWLRSPITSFTLKTDALFGENGIYCDKNLFNLVYQGYERICILMANDDMVVRKVTSCIFGSDYTYLGFDTMLDRDIKATNHLMIGRFLLGRFNTDRLKFSYDSINVSTTELQFLELVNDYSLAD